LRRKIFSFPVLLISSVAAFLMHAGTAHAGQMIICNKQQNPVQYAMIWDEGIPIFADFWKASGWFRIEPGECQTVLNSRNRQELYLSVLEIPPQGGSRLFTPKLDDSEIIQSGYRGIEIPFCVKADSFQRTESNLDDLKRCPPDYYQQLFNFLLFSAKGVNFTFQLK